MGARTGEHIYLAFAVLGLKEKLRNRTESSSGKELRVSSSLLMKVHWMSQGSMPEMQYSTTAVILIPVCQNLLENLLKTDDSAPPSVPKSAGL